MSSSAVFRSIHFKITLALFVLFAAPLAVAGGPGKKPAPQKIARVTADYYPTEEYFIYVQTDENNKVVQMIYQDDQQKTQAQKWRVFSLKDMAQGVVLFNVEGYDVVKLVSAPSLDGNSATLNVDYLRFAPKEKYRSVEFTIALNPHTQQYEMSDASTGQVIRELFVVTNYFKFLGIKKPVGIDEIQY
jgi:hypothetical protein